MGQSASHVPDHLA